MSYLEERYELVKAMRKGRIYSVTFTYDGESKTLRGKYGGRDSLGWLRLGDRHGHWSEVTAVE